MPSRAPVLALALALALLAPTAVAASETYRYVVATGVPALRTFLHCGFSVSAGEISFNRPGATFNVNGQQVGVPGGQVVVHPGGELKPSHGGACLIPVTPGETLAVRVADDLAGPDAAFGFQVFFGGVVDNPTLEFADCGEPKRAVQATTVTVPPDCHHMDVIVDMVSLAGTVTVTR